jgi:hypothetical protein
MRLQQSRRLTVEALRAVFIVSFLYVSPGPAFAVTSDKAFAAINTSLDEMTAVDFIAVPLHRVVEELSKRCGLSFRLDTKALAEMEIRDNTPVTLTIARITLRSALNLVARSLGIGWTIRDGEIIVTTAEQAEKLVETRRHEVFDLITTDPNVGRDNEADLDYDSLAEVAMIAVEPTTWDAGSGSPTGWLKPDHGTFIFEQVPRAHHECEELFNTLRRVIREKPDYVWVGPTTRLRNEERLRNALEKRASLNVTNVPLRDVLAMLARQQDVPIVMDRRDVVDQGLAAQQVSLQTNETNLASVLKSLLEPLKLMAVVHDEAVLVLDGKRPYEGDVMTLVVYRTGDLMTGDEKACEVVRTKVQQAVEKGWLPLGNGDGTWFRDDSLLVCRATAESQANITALLTALREKLGRKK